MTLSSQSAGRGGPATRRPAATRADHLVPVLAALTVVGFVVPNAMVILHVVEHGASISGYFGAWVDSLPGAQLFADLVICSIAFLVWAATDGHRLGVRWLLMVPATLLVGLCFSLPLYLYLRERAIAATDSGVTRRA